MKSLMTRMEVQSWRWEKLQDHWFVTQVYKYLPCCSKFFPSFKLLFKGSQEITQEVSHPHYTRGIVDLGICTFCSKEGLQVVPWAELPLVAGLEESNLHNSTKVKDTLWKSCSLQCFRKLCLPWNYIHGVFQGIITACAVQVSRADPHHYVSMPFPKDTITQDADRYCSYLRSSRQECISTRLPDINSFQPITSALSQNLNLQPQAERLYMLLLLPHLHLLLFLLL